jgi:hypothetical protein
MRIGKLTRPTGLLAGLSVPHEERNEDADPTELVGSLPRPMKLPEAYKAYDEGSITFEQLQAEQAAAAEDSIKRLEETGEPIVTDGEQHESSFATYPITYTLAGTGLADHLAGDGQFFAIFDDGRSAGT